MESVVPRVTGARSTGPGLTGRAIRRALTAALVSGAAAMSFLKGSRLRWTSG